MRRPVLGLAALAGLLALGALLLSAQAPVARLIGVGYGWLAHVPPPAVGAEAEGALRRAAVQYDLVCAACHASPADPLRGAALDFSPPAPRLHERIDNWPPELLFRIVMHGSPASAMPAWPAPGRDDEVSVMTAFLGRLPELDVATYRRLAGLDAQTDGFDEAATCRRCHEAGGAAPRLDLQSPDYLAEALVAFRAGARRSGYMQAIATRLSDADIERLATLLSGSERPPEPSGPAPILAREGDPDRKIGACLSCHDFDGPRDPSIPVLAGLDASYLAAQLKLFLADEDHRGGGPFLHLMLQAVPQLTEAEITELSDWFAAL